MSLEILRTTLLLLGTAALSTLAGCGGKAVVDGFNTEGSGGGSSVGVTATAGSNGAGGAGSATLPPSCDAGKIGFAGTIAGNLLFDVVNQGLLFGTEDTVGGITESGGVFVFPSGIGDPAPSLGFVRIPDPSAGLPSLIPTSPGQWICDSKTQTADTIVGFPAFLASPVTLSSLRRLGTCPGKPIGGEFVCKDASCTLGEVGGTMTGGEVDTSTPGLTAFFEGGLFLNISAESGGMLLLPRDHADAGALYCVGSVVSDGGAVKLGKLSRLGTCAEGEAIAGDVTVCEGTPVLLE